jgi:hypothetical protein
MLFISHPGRATVAVAVVLLAVAGCSESSDGSQDAGTGSALQDAVAADLEQDVGGSHTADVAETSSGAEVAAACPGAPGCTCSDNVDCDTGLCIDTPTGKQCAHKCVDSCPTGFKCSLVQAGGGDSVTICVPLAGRLCNPCKASKDCQTLGIASPVCVAQGPNGNFCGIDCITDSGCPDGYACQQVVSVEGAKSQQCVRKPDAGAPDVPGECPCSAYAMAQLLETTCALHVKDASGKVTGTCLGKRVCAAGGLSACSAPPPSSETCNGKDDDCDGDTDEASCDDQNPCTQDICDPSMAGAAACSNVTVDGPCNADNSVCTDNDQCTAGKCTPGKAKKCDDGNPCSKDGCDAIKGCVSAPDDGAPCDDENACTLGDKCFANVCQAGSAKECASVDTCVDAKCSLVDGKCKFTNKPEGLSCSDGTVCTKDDVCVAGACSGKVLSCSDNNPCTDDSCNAALGCTWVLNNAPCDDGNACTIGDACKAALCSAGIAKPCDDSNPCTNDGCDKASGGCTTVANSLPCSDGNSCTVGDNCKGGTCVPGPAKDCADGNPCTLDVCDGVTAGCTNLPADATCSDGDSCTTGDSCQGGQCKPASVKNCSDGDSCTVDACNASTGACSSKLIVGCGGSCAVDGDCDDANPCTDNKCVAAKCAFVPNSAPCDDKDGCSLADQCAGGACVGGPAKNCDDGNPCTADICAKQNGACANASQVGPCSDNNACTAGDACSDGKCVPGKAKACNDDNPCTSDTCLTDSGDCAFAATTGACDDGSACTVGDACAGGKCTGGPPKDCSDGNACTADACANGTCDHPAIAANCDDGNQCTVGDACAKGQCVAGQPQNCDDGNVCTDNVCAPSTGACANPNNSAACTDGNACTQGDACSAGACVPGSAKNCDDNQPCTADACNSATGACSQSPIIGCGGNCAGNADCNDKNVCTTDACTSGKCSFPANFAACEDGNPCTLTDKCANGSCTPGIAKPCDDSNPCTDDSCDTSTGGCVNKANLAPCSDNSACTVKDACASGACVPGSAIVCSDGNPCTDDACQPATGNCAATANSASCSDGNACTSGDGCVSAACKAGAAKNCDDANPCTSDSCDPATGKCVQAANSAPCSDSNACTLGDQCQDGACKAGPTKACDDGNGCTTDSCDPTLGVCLNLPNTAACSDANACTLNDVCKSAACQPGVAKVCNDGDACTTDGCDKASGACTVAPIIGCGGNCKTTQDCDDSNPCTDNACTSGKCVFPNNTAACSDGNACTLNDVCTTGKCQPGAAKSCDDSNPCTNDSCNAASGACAQVNNAASCSDGNACTLSDTCSGGACVPGAQKVCNDNNPCTDDSCSSGSGACAYLANTATCSDNNACTVGDQCKASACSPGAAKNCDDSNVCTADSCSASTGCVNAAQTASCDDGNACTVGDACASGACKPGAAKDCDDKSICTTGDSCDPKTGCQYTPNANIYKDCAAVLDAKVGGDGVYCIDPDGAGSNAAVQTYCDIKNGGWTLMSHRAKTTEQGTCTVGTAKGVGNVLSPTAAVDAKFDDAIVQSFVNPMYRFDGDYSASPIRQYWLIQQPWTALWEKFTPQYKCTVNSADFPSGWKTTSNPGVYPLGDTTCKGATHGTIWFHASVYGCGYIGDPGGWAWRNHVGGTPAHVNLWVRSGACKLDSECDDKNPCTTDTCDAVKGQCGYVTNTAACNDGNACTQLDACDAGKCVGSNPKNCDDGNPCTTDGCTAATGACTQTNNTAACSDNNACTTGDACSSGKCNPGATVKTCNDNSVCTNDSCDPVTGNCLFVPNGNYCPDFSMQSGAFDVSSDGGLTVAGHKTLTDKISVQCFNGSGAAVKPSIQLGTVKYTATATLRLARSRNTGISFVTWHDFQSWPNPPYDFETYTAIVDAQCNVLVPQTRLEPTAPKGIIRFADVAASDGDLGAYFYEHQSWSQYRLVVLSKTGAVVTAIDAGKGTCGNGALSRSLAMDRSTGRVVLGCETLTTARYVRRFEIDGTPVDPNWIAVPEANTGQWHNFATAANDFGQFAFAAASVVTFFDSNAAKAASVNVGTMQSLWDRQLAAKNGDYLFRVANSLVRYTVAGKLVASKPSTTSYFRLDGAETLYQLQLSGNAIIKGPLGL